MAVKYQFTTENWRSLGAYTQNAAYTPGGALIPIPPFECPIVTDSSLVAVFITCSRARITWNWAGFALQRIFTGLSGGGAIDGTFSSHKLYLNRINLLKLEQPQVNSSLQFIIPRYFPSWECSAWEYFGFVEDDIKSIKGIVEAIQLEVSQ